MTQIEKYIWLIKTISRAGKISFSELSELWERHTDLSYGQPLTRASFNRWKDAILLQFGIDIACQRKAGYLYYIKNPETISEDELKTWIIDSFAVSNLIGENISLRDRIVVDKIPSGYEHLAEILASMKENRVLNIAYHSFRKPEPKEYDVEPYCIKLFENRWYMLANNISKGVVHCYALDRIDRLSATNKTFKMPKNFSASEFYANYFGIVSDADIKPVRIVLRAYRTHKSYMETLPLHHSQRMIGKPEEEHADFELYLSPTYDFIMRLLHYGAMIEVLEPVSLRKAMKGWITDMAELYEND